MRRAQLRGSCRRSRKRSGSGAAYWSSGGRAIQAAAIWRTRRRQRSASGSRAPGQPRAHMGCGWKAMPSRSTAGRCPGITSSAFGSGKRAVIRLENVTKQFPGGSNAVLDLTLDIATGQTCVLIGPSGCGKTTTLRMINRLIEPDRGRILIDGEDTHGVDPAQLRLKMGYVIQQTGLFPHMTVGENVGTVPRLWQGDKARIKARVEELVPLVGLDPAQYRDRYPHQLSGGQRQRVGFARALGADPPILLMDEPFGAVDRITRERLQHEFINIQRSVRKTVVFVTH